MTEADHEQEPLTFRWSTPEDGGTIHGIWERSVQATHDFLTREDFGAISEIVRTEYAPHERLLLAERGGRVIGFMGMTGLKIDGLFVDPEASGQGVGRAFIAQADKAGSPLEVDVNEQNAGARAFYERLGFVVIGRSEVDDQGRPYPLLHMRREV